MSDRMNSTPHMNYFTTAPVQSTFTLRVLRAQGLSGPNLLDVNMATAGRKADLCLLCLVGLRGTLVVRHETSLFYFTVPSLYFYYFYYPLYSNVPFISLPL